MSRDFARPIAAALCSIALSLVLPSAASASWIGSNLVSVADLGVCPVPVERMKASCTHTQLRLAPEHKATRGIVANSSGVITRWRVKSGPASPATAKVKLRLRVLRGGEPLPEAHARFVQLPLRRPGVHRFPARVPINRGDQIALDSIVVGDGTGPAAAPIAHSAAGVGALAEWTPRLGERGRTADGIVPKAELLLEARFEPDRDHDGFGDWTQDECPTDPKRHVPCTVDLTPPRIKISFAKHQDFLHTRRVVLRIHSNERAHAIVGGTLSLPRVAWGIYSDRGWIPKGGTAKFVLRIPPEAHRAGRRAFEKGREVYVYASVSATDTAGNTGREKPLRVRPLAP